MSLIIKGMKMPGKSERRECSIAVVKNRPVSIAFSRTETNPLGCFECAEIPTPHGRLIDVDELLLRIQNSGNYLSPAILAFIETAETIIDKEE